MHTEVARLTPDGRPDKPARLNNLANSLRSRFEHLGELNDLDQAILKYREAIQFTVDGHPDRPGQLSNLADSFRTRFEHLSELNDLELAILQYSNAARTSTGPTTIRFRASQRWISIARSVGHHSLLDAYSVSIGLLPQLAWIGFSLRRRYHELLRDTDVVREGAAAALDLGHPELAVEWLEQGRSVVWGELLQLRSSFDELSSAYPDHARQLRQLSAELEHAGATLDK